MLKVMVTGGRNLTDVAWVFATLDYTHGETPITCLISGGCPTGADEFAIQWAKKREVNYRVYPAKWATHGKAAGPLRNQEMIDAERPDLTIVYAGGRGTKDCADRVIAAGLRLRSAVDPW